jgi:hypothetical protein
MTATASALSWADDPSELADLWRWLDARGWPSDGGRRPDPAVFMCEAHRWAEERERMVTECPECEGRGWNHPECLLPEDEGRDWCVECGGTGRRA